MKYLSLLGVLFFTTQITAQPIEAQLLGTWFDTEIPGSIYYDNAYNEVWGVAVNGEEYAIIGSTLGTHFINVTDPTNPTEDFFIEGAVSADIIVHRDYHDYNGYLYAVADEDYGDNQSTLQIMDISQLPNSVDLVYDSNEFIRKAHNIFIDSSSATLYALSAGGGDWSYAAAKLYDISNPTSPQILNVYNEFDGFDIGHVHDGFVQNNIAYLNCGFDGFAIVDFSDPQNEILLGGLSTLDYPESGYNHSGWLSQDGKYYYMADETWGKAMKVLDVSEPGSIQTVTTFDAGSTSDYSIAHNIIAHCNYLFVSHYYDGLQVYDISDPANPVRIMHYPTSGIPHQDNYEGAWGVYPFLPSGNILVSDMQEGLFVIQGFENNCDQTSAIDQKPIENKSLVYPNPAQNIVNVELSNQHANSEITLQLFDAFGRLLIKETRDTFQELQLTLDNIQASVLFLKIESKAGHEIHRIVRF